MNTSKINRVEVIDHTKPVGGGGGRAYTYWKQYGNGIANPRVEVQLQDDGRTLKVFIS